MYLGLQRSPLGALPLPLSDPSLSSTTGPLHPGQGLSSYSKYVPFLRTAKAFGEVILRFVTELGA